jgi:hypothetical protein
MQGYALYRGQTKPEDVLEAVRQPNEPERKLRTFYAHLYLGLYAEITGDKKKALEHLKAAEDLPSGPRCRQFGQDRPTWSTESTLLSVVVASCQEVVASY